MIKFTLAKDTWDLLREGEYIYFIERDRVAPCLTNMADQLRRGEFFNCLWRTIPQGKLSCVELHHQINNLRKSKNDLQPNQLAGPSA